MSNTPIRVILVDDHPAVRQTLKTILGSNPLFEIIADCEHGELAIEKAEDLNPDIMIVDINMEPMNGFEVTEKVLEMFPFIKIIALSINNQPKYLTRMLELGAKGYLTKTSSPNEMMRGIIAVNDGEIYICEEMRKHFPSEK